MIVSKKNNLKPAPTLFLPYFAVLQFNGDSWAVMHLWSWCLCGLCSLISKKALGITSVRLFYAKQGSNIFRNRVQNV